MKAVDKFNIDVDTSFQPMQHGGSDKQLQIYSGSSQNHSYTRSHD